MKLLSLSITTLFVAPLLALGPIGSSVQSSEKWAPQDGEPAPTETKTQEASKALPTSAYQGMLMGLRAVQGTTGDGHVQVLSASSEYKEGSDGVGPHIAVSLELRVHSTGGAAAEAAFRKLEKSLAQPLDAKVTAPTTYDDSVAQLINPSFDAGGFDRSNTGTHRGAVQMKIPAGMVATTADPTEAKEENSKMLAAIRGIANGPKVRIGAVKIAPGKVDVETGQRLDWVVTRHKKEEPVLCTQAANYFHTLDTFSESRFISRVEIKSLEGKKLMGGTVRISRYVTR